MGGEIHKNMNGRIGEPVNLVNYVAGRVCMLVVLVLLVSCARTDTPPITVQQGQNVQQTSKGKDLLLSNDKMQYHIDVLNAVNKSWRIPKELSSKKDLQTLVTIKIRKDGTIVDLSVDKGSGDKAYDESIIRAVRAAEPLPAIPAALNTDFVELGFRFRPTDTGEEQSKD
jgi:TonB family protein